jgi:hypothetical protein
MYTTQHFGSDRWQSDPIGTCLKKSECETKRGITFHKTFLECVDLSTIIFLNFSLFFFLFLHDNFLCSPLLLDADLDSTPLPYKLVMTCLA